MIVPDINLLLYAYDSDSQFHSTTLAWWQGCLSGTETVGLPQVVVFGFVRVGTNARVFHRPMTVSEAAANVRSWLEQPVVQVLDSDSNHTEQTLKLLESVGVGGNLVTDAQIAAIAIEHGGVVHTSDTDFIRFPGLRWFNPITGVGSGTLRRGRTRNQGKLATRGTKGNPEGAKT